MSDQNLENKHLPVNEENDFDEISLDESDETGHYTIVPNILIRDATISPECRCFVMYFLSMKTGWRINTSQLANHLKDFMGRDRIRKVMNEAIEAGYIKREIIKLKGPNGGFLNRCTYLVSSKPKFKKSLRRPENQGPGNREPENQGPGNTSPKELTSESLTSKENTLLKVPKGTEKRVTKSPIESFSSQVLETSQLMIEGMRIVKPDYSAQNGKLLGILNEVERMIELDKRDASKIVEVFRWALADSFWADKMFKPNPAKYLRDKFDQLEMKMNAETQQVIPVEKPKENAKATLSQRLKEKKITYEKEFGNIIFRSSTGYVIGKIAIDDPDALEDWLVARGC